MALTATGAAVLGAANTISAGPLRAGAVNAFLLDKLGGNAVAKLGMRYAALGGRLVKGVFVWKLPDTREVSHTLRSTVTRVGGLESSIEDVPVVKSTPGGFASFAFPMNPEELSETVSPNYAVKDVPGQNRPLYQFISGGARELSFTLHFFYDDRNRKTISDQIRALRSLTERPLVGGIQPSGAALGTSAGPPPLYFYFGEHIRGERFVVTKFESRVFDMFDPALLLPLRAEVNLTLAEVPATGLNDPNRPVVRIRDTLATAGTILSGAF